MRIPISFLETAIKLLSFLALFSLKNIHFCALILVFLHIHFLYRRYLHGNINKASVITTLPRLEHNQLLWYNHYYCNSKEKAYIKSSQCLIHMLGEV